MVMSASDDVIEKIDEVLRFLPVFRSPEFNPFKKWTESQPTSAGALTLPYPIYAEEIGEFVAILNQDFWVKRDYNPTIVNTLIEDVDYICTASLEDLKYLLTYFMRGERFCDGFWGHLIERRTLIPILERLKIIRDSYSGNDASENVSPG